MNKISLKIDIDEENDIIKFLASTVLIDGSHEFSNVDEAKNFPIIQQLFHLPFVKSVYCTANIIAIEKFPIISWEDVHNELKTQLEQQLNTESFTLEKKRATEIVEVYSESTPNPEVLKFVTNLHLTSTIFECNRGEPTDAIPIAKELFKYPFIEKIFVSQNYISITKNDTSIWEEVIPKLRSFIKNYINDAGSIVDETKKNKNTSTSKKSDAVSVQIQQLLDTYIVPAIAMDGGNILFDSYNANTKTVNVILQGACNGCPSSTMTLKNGIETLLKEHLPNKIETVISLN